MAGGVMAFVNCPVELLKVKLQTQYKPAAGALPIAGAVKPVRLLSAHSIFFVFQVVQGTPKGMILVLMIC